MFEKRGPITILIALALLTLLLISNTVLATPSFVDPTLYNNTLTSNTTITINISIPDPVITNITYNWNGSNYTMYDNSTTLLHMGFNNLSGIGENATSAVDVSSRQRNGTITGAIFNATGRYGGSYSFMGGNEYIQTDRSFMNNLSTFTVAGWVYVEASGSRIGFFGQNDAVEFGYIDSTTLELWTPDGGSVAWVINNAIFPQNQWNFVTVTANNQTAPYLNLYINAISRATGGSLTDTFGNSVSNFSIGGRVWDPTNNNFTGMIDEVMVFNRTLSADQVYELYTSNLYKYHANQWYLSINQSQNATNTLNNGTYTYQIFTTNTTGTQDNTPQWFLRIGQLPNIPEWGTIGLLVIISITLSSYFYHSRKYLP